MQMTSRRMTSRRVTRARALPFLLVLAVPAAACDRDDGAQKATETKAPPVRAPVPPPAPALPLGAVPGSDEAAPSRPASSDGIVAPGEWTENKQYKFRFERVEACGPATPALGPARPERTGAVGSPRGDTSWVGALFSVQAKDKSVFVSPRDLDLRRGGVILNAKYINQPVLPGCTPLLPAQQLRAGKSLAGFALLRCSRCRRASVKLLRTRSFCRIAPHVGAALARSRCRFPNAWTLV
jgi:hypothetical protein